MFPLKAIKMFCCVEWRLYFSTRFFVLLSWYPGGHSMHERKIQCLRSNLYLIRLKELNCQTLSSDVLCTYHVDSTLIEKTPSHLNVCTAIQIWLVGGMNVEKHGRQCGVHLTKSNFIRRHSWLQFTKTVWKLTLRNCFLCLSVSMWMCH